MWETIMESEKVEKTKERGTVVREGEEWRLPGDRGQAGEKERERERKREREREREIERNKIEEER